MEISKSIIISFIFSISICFSSFSQTNIVIIGDSLSAGYGVQKSESYPQVVKEILKKDGIDVKILNGSVSGSTTSSLMSRLKWYKKTKPNIIIIALGANDGLRGVPIKTIKENLEKGIKFSKEITDKVILLGMLLPLNYGDKYRDEFESTFKKLAKKYKVTFMPFLLKDVAGIKKYNQEDGIHPNKEGHLIMAKNVKNVLKEVINVKSK